MCNCCCPPAINALFCLWIQSGFSKSCVAGALTFFPPDPAFYKFQRLSADGKALKDETDDELTDEEESLCSNDAFTNSKNRRETSLRSATSFTERANISHKRAKQRRRRDKHDHNKGVTYSLVLDPRLRRPMKFSGKIQAIKLYNAKTKSFLAVVIYRQRIKGCKTILYSHGNASDIGAMSMRQSILANMLKANVVVYDYSGYGESGGVASEKNTYYDIQTVYDFCVSDVSDGIPENVIVYGESVGSGPSCHLSSKKIVGGLILHCPFTSGMRVLTQSRALACLDVFPNIDRIKKVKCPVMVIHGAKDRQVNMAHGVALHEAVPNKFKREPWWVPDRGHNDICEGAEKMEQYVTRLRAFLTSLDNPEMQKALLDAEYDDDILGFSSILNYFSSSKCCLF